MRVRPYAGTLLLLFLSGGCASLRTVEEGKLYRSGQLTARQLEDAIADRGIKTVVNLRGPQPAARWYQAEAEVCQRAGVRMVDIALDTSTPDRGEIAALLETYHTAPAPILVHSWSRLGSVGLASGLYRASILQESNEQARKELAPWMSSRWPIRSLSEHDRFLKEWQGERDFFATYQLAGRDDLPDLESHRSVAYRAKASLRSSPPAPGSSLPLPAPALELFAPSASSAPSSPPNVAHASPDSPSTIVKVRLDVPIEIADRREPGDRRVFRLGSPVEIGGRDQGSGARGQ